MNQTRFNDLLHFWIAWLILVLWLNRVARKYDFKLGKYRKSNGTRFVEYGWWIARWNPNTSMSSNVILVVWHRAMYWCNTTFPTGAARSGRFFYNRCMRSRRTVQDKTTHHFLNVKDKIIKSFKHTIEFNACSRVTYSSRPMLGCVLCCIFTNTGHPSNFSYGALLITVDGVRCGFYYSAILVLRPPTRCIIRANVAKSTMPSIYKCSSNILVTFCWFKLTTRGDRRQDWWKTKLTSLSMRRVFVWRRHFLLDISMSRCTSCVSFLKIPQKVCNSSYSHDMTFHRENGRVRLLTSFK